LLENLQFLQKIQLANGRLDVPFLWQIADWRILFKAVGEIQADQVKDEEPLEDDRGYKEQGEDDSGHNNKSKDDVECKNEGVDNTGRKNEGEEDTEPKDECQCMDMYEMSFLDLSLNSFQWK